MQESSTENPVVTFLIDRSGMITLSGCFDPRLGLKQEISPGQSIFALAHDNAGIAGIVRRALGGKHVTSTITVNGQVFSNSYAPLLDAEGNVIVDHSRNMRLNVEPEAVNFEHIVHATFEHLQFMDHVNRLRKVVNIRQGMKFYTSPTRLDIIFNNLISNAIKYADLRKEDPFLEITVIVNDATAEIRVRDNGEGIPADAQPRIFDMFFRASGRGSGSGLGLYIVKEAIQKIDGNIQVRSVYGQGTEFIVQIPNLTRRE